MNLPRHLAFVVCALLSASRLPSQQDNVLVLLADDVGVDAISVYGEGANPPPTPNIDALAANGVLFRNAWSYPACSPTRACIQTGRYGFRTGIGHVPHRRQPLGLPLAETTLPELLDANQSGYAHAAIGKWHLGNSTNGQLISPNLAGWSHFAGNPVEASWNYFLWNRTVDGVQAVCTTYCTTQNVDDALAWIQSAPEPWICYVAFLAGHQPFHRPPRALHTQTLEGQSVLQNPTPFFKATVEAMDTEIGRLLSSLGSSLVSRTNVIFLSDNGTTPQVVEPPFLPSHAKKTPYEGALNVPLIIAGPAVGTPGREEAALVSTVDLFPTMAELCGVPAAVPFVKIDGVSFVPHLRAPNQPPVRSTVYAEWFTADDAGFATVRDATYKLIRRFDTQQDELYELIADPFEQNDLLLGSLNAVQAAAYSSLSDEITSIRDTSGSVVPYGATGCVGSNGNPSIGIAGTPRVGSSYTVSLQGGATNQPAVLYLGASNSQWGSLSLPLPLPSLGGGPSCFLYASGETKLATSTDGNGQASLQVQVPSASTLVAASFYHSWLVVDPSAPNNPFGATGSDGVEAIIGQ